jgi:hypothetical protein
MAKAVTYKIREVVDRFWVEHPRGHSYKGFSILTCGHIVPIRTDIYGAERYPESCHCHKCAEGAAPDSVEEIAEDWTRRMTY